MEVDEIRVAKIANELHQFINHEIELNGNSGNSQPDLTALLSKIDQFQPCPQLLDKHLRHYVDLLLKFYIGKNQKWTAEAFYTFGKIVSSKKMLNFMKTDIDLLPTILSKLEKADNIHWHEKYLLLCWLAVLCLAPFKLDSLQKDAKQQIFYIGSQYSKQSGPLQPLGSRVLASLVMRSDCEEQFEEFMKNLSTEYALGSEIVQKGYLATLNIALQKDSNMRFQSRLKELLQFIEAAKNSETSVDMVVKIYSKLVKYLIDADDYDQIEDIITFFLENFSNRSTGTRFLLARKFVKLVSSLDSCFGIEIIVDVIHSTKEILQEHSETINSDKLHTYLLTLAEFLRLTLVDSYGYKDILSILSKTLFFQQSRITYIAGSNIRDASNFICWSLFKYNKDVDLQIAFELFKSLLFATCFDKEIMIRRSSTAALQELIGRYGNKIWDQYYPNEENFAKNIKLIEILDYVDLGSIEKAYFEIPEKILILFPDSRLTFIEFLSDNVYNVDNEVVRLSSKALRLLLFDQPKEALKRVVLKHANNEGNLFNSFIALAEILPLYASQEHLDTLTSKFDSLKLNHHKDPLFVLSSYLSLLNTLLELGVPISENSIENLFDIIRVDDDLIKNALAGVASKITLTEEHWQKWQYYMRNNNINTCSSVGYFPDFATKADDVITLLSNERVDADAKAAILSSISGYLQKDSLGLEALEKVVHQLDDYTISEQGDVGNKIRSQTIKLIDNNTEHFKEPQLRSIVEPKLLRLSCEPIDKTRIASLNLLHKIHNIPNIQFQSLDEYFTYLLEFYSRNYIQDKEISKEFWRGYIFTSGAIKATDSLIISSLKSFLRFYQALSDETQKEILLQLASIIKIEPIQLKKANSSQSQRLNKTILVGLQFWSRIMEANLPIPDSFPLKGLYVRIYNLHLNTRNIVRLSSSIKIFGSLINLGLEEPLKRLAWLTTYHPIARVRVLASEELFNVYNERSLGINNNANQYVQVLELLSEVDWNKSGNEHYEAQLLV